MRTMPKTPVEKSIDLNTEAIRKLTSLYSNRSTELKPYIRMATRALEDIADALRGIEMELNHLNEREEGAIDGRGGTSQKEPPDLDQHAGD